MKFIVSVFILLSIFTLMTSCSKTNGPQNDVHATDPSGRYCAYDDDGVYRPYNLDQRNHYRPRDYNCNDVNRVLRRNSDVLLPYRHRVIPDVTTAYAFCPHGTSPVRIGYGIYCAYYRLLRTCNIYTDQWACRCVPVTWYGYNWGQGICM